ncbi:MAG: FAD-linked oxidase C-terminal domain-containing protein [Chloroflexota bacterium]
MITPQTFKLLEQITGSENISLTEADRVLHSQDESTHPPVMPDVVIWPTSTEIVSRTAALAHEYHIPITPWGAGTGLEGHAIPLKQGISLNFQRMDKLLAVHAEDFQVTVQPGIFRKALEKELAPYGLMFAPDPGANASIGGMLANNAAGIRTVKYGAARDNVLALEVVMANGDILRTGSRSIKQSAGYDLTHLFTGSEGTLGIITEATLQLVPIPEQFSTATVAFNTVQEAADAVYGIIGSGLEPAALELIHQDMIGWMNADSGTDFTVAPSIMMEFTGATAAAVKNAVEMAKQVCEEAGSIGFQGGLGREARSKMWSFRHGIRERMVRTFPGEHWIIVDLAVPISNFPPLVAFCQEKIYEYGFDSRIVGHAGDGNMHCGIHFRPDDHEAQTRAAEMGAAMVTKTLELEGTCTGEHGIGIGKQKYMLAEHGETALHVMRTIKSALDPRHILNPGKVLVLD